MTQSNEPNDMHAGEPQVDRPIMPNGYGVPDSLDGVLSWDEVVARLRASSVYWLATTRPDGRPHVVPRWGAWMDEELHYDGSPETVHVRNLDHNSSCALHLEDGTRAVILEGAAGPVTEPPLSFRQRLAAEMARKYGRDGYTPEPDSWTGPDAGGLCRFVPQKAMAWTAFPNDVTRFSFHR